MADLLCAYKTMSGTRQTRRQAVGSMGFKSAAEVKAAIDAGLVTFAKERKNNAGGFSFSVTPLQQARRFVILGVSSGTFYVGKLDLLKQNMGVLNKVVADGQWKELVDMVVDISEKGLAPKQDTVIFVLAWLSCHEDDQIRAYTFKQLGKVLRTPTMQFDFIFKWRAAIRETQGKKGHGWGRGMRNAFMRIYLDKDTKQLAYHVTKYQRRDGASQRDVLRLLHPSVGGKRKIDGSFKADGLDPWKNLVFAWAVNGGKLGEGMTQDFWELCGKTNMSCDFDVLKYLSAVDEALRTDSAERAIELIRANNLVREQVSTQVLKSVPVWGVLLESMPMTALLRNLASMTAKGVFQGNDALDTAVKTLTNHEAVKKARIHPLNVYKAIKVYNAGRGDKGSLNWVPVPQIQDAMQKMFQLSFKYGPKTGKKLRVCIDVSGSMGAMIAGMNMSCAEAAAVMSLAFVYAGDPVELCKFDFAPSGGRWGYGASRNLDAPHGLQTFMVRPDCTVANFMVNQNKWGGGGTDCALPMIKAIEAGDYSYDGFVVFTDSETWHGKIKPFEALAHYSFQSKKQAKLVVCGMTGTAYTIADPNNPNMLDVVGCDSSMPTVVTEFLAGKI